jgi:hypothetical protein
MPDTGVGSKRENHSDAGVPVRRQKENQRRDKSSSPWIFFFLT